MIRRHRPKPPLSWRTQISVLIVILLIPIGAIWQGLWVSKNRENFRPFMLHFQLERVDCPFCDRTGLVRDEETGVAEMCPICFGTGSRQVRKLDLERDVLCPACGGMGRVWDPELKAGRTCERCKGRGLIEMEGSGSSDR